MALSDSQKLHAQNELSIYVTSKNINEVKVSDLMEICEKYEFDLSIDESDKFDALTKAINAGAKSADLEKWGKECQQIDQKKTLSMQQMAQGQPLGLCQYLKNNRSPRIDTWCKDQDLKACMTTVMKTAHEVKGKGTYLLTPVSLDSEAGYQPHTALQNNIVTVLDQNQNEKENIKLLIPVESQGHWRLAKVDIKNAQIESATLWDSLKNPDLKTASVFKVFSDAIAENSLIRPLNCQPEATGVQDNGYSCGDYVLKEALKELTKEQTPEFEAIRNAKNAEELRAAMISSIITRNPGKGYSMEDELEEKLSKSLSQSEAKGVQIAFDEAMAKKLQELYEKYPNADEHLLAKQARDAVYQDMKAEVDLTFKDDANVNQNRSLNRK